MGVVGHLICVPSELCKNQMAAKLSSSLRLRLKELFSADGWRVEKSSMQRLLASRFPSASVRHEIYLTPGIDYQSDGLGSGLVVRCWFHITFQDIEDRIARLVGEAGHKPDQLIAARRTAGIPLTRLAKKNDPTTLFGYPLSTGLDDAVLAEEFFGFVNSRAGPILKVLSSPRCLEDDSFLPPFTTRTAWGTRQMLRHAAAGRVGYAATIGKVVETTAPRELTESVRALSESADEGGYTFLPSPHALDHRAHPQWLEFNAVYAYIQRLQ